MTERPDGDQLDAAADAAGCLVAGLGQLAATQAWQLSDEQLTAAVAGLDRVGRLLEAQRARLVGEAASRGLPGRRGHGRLAHWVREVVPTMSEHQAAKLARRAEALYASPLATALGPTRQASLAGDLSADQTDVLTATISALLPPVVPAGTIDDDTVGEAQQLLIEQAKLLDGIQLGRVGQYVRARLDPDADARLAKDDHARDRARGLTVYATASGMVQLDGLLTPEAGAAVTTAIDALAAPLPADDDGTPDRRTAAQRRHDALAHLARAAIADPGALPSTHGSPYRIVTIVPHSTLVAALTGRPLTALQPATLPDGHPLTATALQVMACQAELVAVAVDGSGSPLDVGRTQYAFPTRQRLAICVRDQHCTWGACRAPAAWCDVHHLQPYGDGGPTSVSNGALLCPRHHRHVHATRQTGQVTDGEVRWDSSPHPSTGTITRATRALDHLAQRWRERMQQ